MSGTPPVNESAEEAVLGAVLQDEGAAATVLTELDAEMFFYRRHREIFVVARDLFAQGTTPDVLTVKEELRRRHKLAEAGGGTYLSELVVNTPATANAHHHARILRETWARRAVLEALQSTAEDVSTDGLVSKDALEMVERALTNVRGKIESGKEERVISAKDTVKWFREKMGQPLDPDDGIQTPFYFLEPMQPSRLYVLGGYQADGKSVAAIQFLKSSCAGGARVGLATTEMSWHDLTDRLVASFGIPYSYVRTGQIPEAYRPTLDAALEEIGSWRYDIIDDEGLSAESLRRYQKLGRYDFLIIDHLHRFDWDDRRQLERSVRSITNLAREYEIPVLLLAQLKRSNDPKKPFPEPTMASLRESGMIEAEASAVWFVWRARDKENMQTTEAKFIVAKNRFGGTYWKPLEFKPRAVSFETVGQ